MKESGPVIVAAALIMFSVFFAFVFQEDVMIKSMGMALAFGVLFDAFVVRMMLIPALTKLFGKGSWYLPAWLNRIIQRVDTEGHALEKYKTVEHRNLKLKIVRKHTTQPLKYIHKVQQMYRNIKMHMGEIMHIQ